ncbi:type II secretion system F family protein [Salinisphaera sp. T31B1]|uniref:type II secretion system F family protein n=1 Tax=Salinisphaera sp. T31B1 TaxID=727963 RepID=UPI00333EFA7C
MTAWVYGALALAILAVALWIYAESGRVSERERLARRLGDTDPTTADAPGEAVGRGDPTRLRNPLIRLIARHCWAAGMEVDSQRIAMVILVAGALALLLIVVFGLIGLGLVGIGIMLGWFSIARRRRTRRRRINTQLPNFLGYLVRALTAGNTLEEGIHSAAMESAEPIRSVFLSVSRQVRLGASIEDTLAEAAAMHDLRALHILAMSARVNRRYGGSMRRVIASLIETIRQQEAAARELKALTGETRFSAYVVAAIPIAISLFFYLQNPAYYAAMLQSSGGRLAVVLALGLEALGLAIIWRMMARLQEPET